MSTAIHPAADRKGGIRHRTALQVSAEYFDQGKLLWRKKCSVRAGRQTDWGAGGGDHPDCRKLSVSEPLRPKLSGLIGHIPA